MKTEQKTEPGFREMQTQFWRGVVRDCATPGQAIATLRNAGYSEGEAIIKLREYNRFLYNLRAQQQPEIRASGDLAKSTRFNFRG
jgi:hypothetical protein